MSVGLDVSGCTIAAAYDSTNTSAAIKSLTCGSFNANMAVGSIGTFSVGNPATGFAGNVTASSIKVLASLKGVALGTFMATGSVYQGNFQVTSGNVTSFQCVRFVNSGLFVGYRLVDPLSIADSANNQIGSNWEGNFTLGKLTTTAVSSADPRSDSFQSAEVVAATLGKLSLSSVNPTPTLPQSIPFGGNQIAIPPALAKLATFGVGFRKQGGAAGSLKVGSTVESPATPPTPTLAPAFFYLGLGG
jgi:hypothetical protein